MSVAGISPSAPEKSYNHSLLPKQGKCRVSATDGDSLPNRRADAPKRSRWVAIVAVVVVAILVVGAFAWFTVSTGNKKSGYTKRSPIVIIGNANFTAANGVIGGSGNVSDPYVIANWDIDAAKLGGIYIWSTDAHFIIRNCYVHGGSTILVDSKTGIDLDNCSNGTLSSNDCSGNLAGIELDGYRGLSHNITIVNNTCNSNGENGITLGLSDNNTLISNKCLSNGRFGIVLDSSSNNIACNNIVSHTTGFGIYILTEFGQTSTRNRIWNNTLTGNNGAGSKYSPTHIQANDSGTGNWWNSTNGYGNYWSDWQSPSLPYTISGKADAKDNYPLATTPLPIQSFGVVLSVHTAQLWLYRVLREPNMKSISFS